MRIIEDIPQPSDSRSINPDNAEGFVNLVLIDMDRYSERYSTKSIRKNLTIPQWLNSRAEKANVNFSQVLQKALLDHLKIAK